MADLDLDLDKMAVILFRLVKHNSNYEIVVISVISITCKHLQASILVSKSILTCEEMFAYMLRRCLVTLKICSKYVIMNFFVTFCKLLM